MAIKFRCAECGHGIKAPEAAAGKGVKCPQCGAKNRVPAASGAAASAGAKSKTASRKKKVAAAQESDAFLENLDLDRLIDHNVQLCQKCATEIPEGETACPNCGFDPEQLTVAGRKRQKMSDQGIDPSTFYETVWKDSFSFAFSHIGQMLKTGTILTFSFLLIALCAYFLVWVATTPPFGFWALLTTVSVMIPIGWLLVQHLEIMRLTLHRKDQIKKIHFDFALCGMSGMKFLTWVLVYGLPLWVVFGGLGILLDRMEVPFGLMIGLGIGLVGLLLVTPQAMSHLSMPVERPGWFLHQVAPTLGVSFLPGMMWALLFLVVNIPVFGAAATVYFVGWEKLQDFAEIRMKEGEIHTAKVMLDRAEGATSEAEKNALTEKYSEPAKGEAPAKNWSSLMLPMLMGLLGCYLLGFSSVVAARANGLFTVNLKKGLNLITSEKEVKWERKSQEDKIRNRRTTLPAAPVKRFAAYFLDVLINAVITGLISFITLQILGIILESAGMDENSNVRAMIMMITPIALGLIIYFAYFVTQESGEKQATMVKDAMNIYICTDDWTPISTGQAFLRVLILVFLSGGLTLGIGGLMALFREDRKTLHDLLTGTQVRMDKPTPKGKAAAEEK